MCTPACCRPLSQFQHICRNSAKKDPFLRTYLENKCKESTPDISVILLQKIAFENNFFNNKYAALKVTNTKKLCEITDLWWLESSVATGRSKLKFPYHTIKIFTFTSSICVTFGTYSYSLWNPVKCFWLLFACFLRSRCPATIWNSVRLLI